MNQTEELAEAYELTDITPTLNTHTISGHTATAAASLQEVYDTPSTSSQPLPAVPPHNTQEVNGMYEIIPGEM